jgi:hypothetical protein
MGRPAHTRRAPVTDTRFAVGEGEGEERLIEAIEALLEPARTSDLDAIERTLTDGYAKALSLEGERWRLERRIGEVVATIGAEDATSKAHELSRLSKRLEESDDDLTRLRRLLAELRAHADAVRAAV